MRDDANTRRLMKVIDSLNAPFGQDRGNSKLKTSGDSQRSKQFQKLAILISYDRKSCA